MPLYTLWTGDEVLVGGAARRELARGSGACGAGAVRESGSVFLSCFLLICIVVVPVPSVCCSVKLPLSPPTGFCLFSFHSPPHRGGGRGGRVALLLPAAAENQDRCKLAVVCHFYIKKKEVIV